MISRRILAAVALLCAPVIPAQAQKTRAQLNSEIETSFPDNNFPLLLRSVTNDIVNSIMPTAPVTSGNLACFSGTTGLLQNCATPVLPGSLTLNPTSGTLNAGLTINQTGPTSGSSVGPWSGNLINSTFGATVTGSSDPFFDFGAWQTWVAAHRVNFTVGGTNLNGEPFGAGFYQMRLTSPANPAGDGDFIGLAGEAFANTAAANAALHGLVGAAIINSGANVNVMNGVFAEVDIEGTALVAQRRGVNIVNQGHHTATGAIDTAIDVASANAAGAFKKFAVFNTFGGTIPPFQNNADLFWSDGAFTVANVFSLPSMTVTGKIFDLANLQVSGAGLLTAGGGTADLNTGAMVNAAVPSGGVAALISQVNGTTGFNGLHTGNSAVAASLFAVVGEPSSATTIFGQANANWAEIISAGGSSNGMLLGTLAASTPIIFGTGNTERMRLNAGLGVGVTADPGPGIVGSLNGFRAGTGTADAVSGALVQGSVSGGGLASLISQANGVAAFSGFHAGNSAANANLFSVVGEPSSATTIFGQANANWGEVVASGPSSNGLLLGTLTASTPIIFGTANTERMRLNLGLGVGATADPGIGKISALNGFVANGSSGLSATKTIRASGGTADCTLIYTGGILTGGTC